MFEFQDIKQYHSQLLAGNADCVSVVNHYLGKISECDHLNAFVEVFSEDALQRARELDQRPDAWHHHSGRGRDDDSQRNGDAREPAFLSGPLHPSAFAVAKCVAPE